jgi:hypothetical protein
MIGKNSAALIGVFKAADHKSGRRRRQWPGRAAACRFLSHYSNA